MRPRKKELTTPRSIALMMLQKVIEQGQSFSSVRRYADALESRDRSLVMEMANGVLRWRWKLEFLLGKLMKKPLRAKDGDVRLVLLLALYELLEMASADYAVVNEAVQWSKTAGKPWASGLINAVLRACIRDSERLLQEVDQDEVATFSYPEWLIQHFKNDWPEQWQSLLIAGNTRPPTWLRVNTLQIDVNDYRKSIDAVTHTGVHPYAMQALKLERSVHVPLLPGFDQGQFSVQDAGAQLTARLLDVRPGQSVLDLCAAPGGKACHLLEQTPGIRTLVAVDLVEERISKVRENLERLKLDQTGADIRLVTGDVREADQWWEGQYFERILVDAPCSATGVIRRHPDIKSLRREEDIAPLAEIQQQILQQAVEMLAPGGLLLYVTCSVLRDENENQVEKLLSSRNDIYEQVIDDNWGVACKVGRQLLPGEDDADGFYYALLCKTSGISA